MLTDLHPIVRALDALPYPCTLVGSRGLGLHRAHSDYDYLLARPSPPKYLDEVDARKKLTAELVALGFTLCKEGHGYGPDTSADVFAWRGKPADVDVIVVSEPEYARRIATIAKLRAACATVEECGRLYRGLKTEKAWPTFWALVRALEVKP